MLIETQALGPIEIEEDRIMKFVDPVLGFEGAVHYALLDVKPESPVKILQMTDASRSSFLVADPAVLFPDYRVEISEQELRGLELDDPSRAVVLVVLTLCSEAPRLTANLRGPLVVNPEKMLAKQVVLRRSAYRVDEPVPLAEAGAAESR